MNKTLGSYSEDYRANVRRVIAGTLDECVRKGIIPRHTVSGIELAPRIVTAEQYEQQNKGLVSVSDEIKPPPAAPSGMPYSSSCAIGLTSGQSGAGRLRTSDRCSWA